MRAEADFDPRVFEDRYSDDKKVWVRFYLNSVEDQVKSAEAGRPIYVEKEYVEIRSPGNDTNIVNRPVSQHDRQRFPRHYDLFKKGVENPIIGTPLSEMVWVKRTMVDELKYVKIITVEQLAEVSDDICGRFPGLTDLKQKARAYLDQASKPDVDELLRRIADLEAKLAEPEEE